MDKYNLKITITFNTGITKKYTLKNITNYNCISTRELLQSEIGKECIISLNRETVYINMCTVAMIETEQTLTRRV